MRGPTGRGIAAAFWAVALVAPGVAGADGGKGKAAPPLPPGCRRVADGRNGALSPDGKRLAFARLDAAEKPEAWVCDLRGKREWKLPHATTPVAWTAGGTLLLRAGFGAEPLKGARDPRVASLPEGIDAWAVAWTRDGRRLAYVPRTKDAETTSVHRIEAGGTAQPLTGAAGLRTDQAVWLAWSPDETRLYVNALVQTADGPRRRIGVVDLSADAMKVVSEMPADSDIPGLHADLRWLRSLDLSEAGSPEFVWKRPSGPRYGADVWDGAGALFAWVEGGAWTEADAFVADPLGAETWRVTVDGDAKWSPALDPAGRRLAFLTAEDAGREGTYRKPRVRVIDLRRGEPLDLPVPDGGVPGGLGWTPDGKHVLYEVRRGPNEGMYLHTVPPPKPALEGAPIRRLELAPAERIRAWLASEEPRRVRTAVERAREEWDAAHVPALRGALASWAPRAEDVGLLDALTDLLAERDVREAVPELRAALASEQRSAVRFAARALRRLGATEALPDLDRVRTGTKSAEVRFAVAAAMARLGDDRGWEDLAAASRRPNREVRLKLCGVLARVRHPRSVDLLIPLVSDSTYLEYLAVGERKKVGDAAQLALEALTGRSLGADPAAWTAWWEGEAKRALPESVSEPADLRRLPED